MRRVKWYFQVFKGKIFEYLKNCKEGLDLEREAPKPTIFIHSQLALGQECLMTSSDYEAKMVAKNRGWSGKIVRYTKGFPNYDSSYRTKNCKCDVRCTLTQVNYATSLPSVELC